MARSLPFLLFLTVTVLNLNAAPLDSYQWKNRLILVAAPDPEVVRETLEAFQRGRGALAERDLKVIDLSHRPLQTPHTIRPAAKDIARLRESLNIESDKPAVFILIGKDGGEKARQTGTLDLQEFLDLIDTMPMRRREMKE